MALGVHHVHSPRSDMTSIQWMEFMHVRYSEMILNQGVNNLWISIPCPVAIGEDVSTLFMSGGP